MNYLFYIIIICSFCGLIFFPLWFKRRLQNDFFGKQAARRLAAEKPLFFATPVIQKTVKLLLRHHRHDLLESLLNGKISKVFSFIATYDRSSSLLLKAFNKPQTAATYFQKQLKKNSRDKNAAMWLALLYEAMRHKNSAAAWDNIAAAPRNRYLKAHYLRHLGETALKNGDLEYASRQFYAAAGLFNRAKAYYEEAAVYLRLGTVYRICFVDDVSETLFLSALKTFRFLKYAEGIAQTQAHLGMLMTGQERFEEAESYLQQALETYHSLQTEIPVAEVQNQLALLYLLQQKFKASQKMLRVAKKTHSRFKNTNGIAFSTELSANCFWKQNDFSETIKYATTAASLYQQAENISGCLECLYLAAQALFKSGNDNEAETLLREIIESGRQDCGCFYLANAYNLLGIIYMKRQDLQRAKGLFQQSLDLEQRGVRSNALAADYANLGLVELCRGQKESAQKNLQTALDFALQTGDEDLCTQLRQHLNRLNN